MDCETKLWLLLFFILNATYMQQHCVVGQPQVPCFFIFGDSLSDNGNNNKLNTEAKVDYLPYGIDFPDGPTGRFTNGRTSVDIITELFGIKEFIPPFANIGGSDILKGVNYASGSAGIRKETGTSLGENISFGEQVQNHKAIVSQISEKLGGDKQAQEHLNKCLYYVNIGSNDYINNYFLPEHYPSSQTYNTDQYASALSQEYSKNLQDVYALGARKFGVIGLSYIGCIPHEISIHGKNGQCFEEENKAAFLFNDKIKVVVDRFNKELADAKLIFVDTAVAASKPPPPTLKLDSCCKVGSNGQCIPDEKPCQNRNQYIYFDAFHPTEITNQLAARSAYNALAKL